MARKKTTDEAAAKKGGARLDQAIVDRIIELRNQGMGVSTIANTLMAEGVKTATGKDTWYGPAIRQILVRNQAMGESVLARRKAAKEAAAAPAKKATGTRTRKTQEGGDGA